MSNKLFDGSDEDADDLQINTNENYAKSYNFLRKKELLQKCECTYPLSCGISLNTFVLQIKIVD